jgi:hypothetical protein
MPGRVTEENQIRINDVLFKTSGKVREFLASTPPGKLTLGDYSDASNPFASEWSFDDARGGIGIEILDPRKDLDRVWYGTTQLRYKGRIVLPRLAVKTTAASTVDDIDIIQGFKNEIYGCHGTEIHVYDNSGDSWGASVRTLLSNATSAAVGILYPSGVATETLVIATGSEVDYATDSSTWARNTTNIKWVVFWHDLLWGMDDAGQLYFTDDLSTGWTPDALLQFPSGYANGLLVARGADNVEHIYCTATVGLFIHDDVAKRFHETEMSELPFHPQGGLGSTKWRGNIYYAAGNAVYRFQPRSTGTVVDTVGPDREYGLPQAKRGVIRKMVPTHNDLIAFLDASVAAGISKLSTRVTRGVRFHHGVTMHAETGFSVIVAWNEDGWEVKWESGASAQAITTGHVSNAYNENRLWWAADKRVYYMTLPVDVVNPLQVPTTTYESTGTLETPWNDFQTRNATKLALRFLLETVNPTSSETVKVEYATDYVESYTEIKTNTVTGETETTFPIGGANPIGLAFRAIKFRVTLDRGSTNTNTPQLIKMTLVWRQRNRELYGIQADLVLGDDLEPEAIAQIANVKASVLNDELVEVTYRDDDSELQNYYMEVINYDAFLETGHNYAGTVRVVMVEPQQTASR